MGNEMSLGSRLNTAMKVMGVGQRQLSATSGVSQANISKLCSGKSERTSYVVELATALGVNPSWLATGDGEMLVGGTVESAADAAIKSFIVKSGGKGLMQQPGRATRLGGAPVRNYTTSINGGYIEEIRLNRSWLSNAISVFDEKPLLLLNNEGDGMSPTINDSEMVLVDSSVTSVNVDGVYAYRLNGLINIKRLQNKSDGSILVISDNRNYQIDTITKDNLASVEVIGLVKSTLVIKRI